MLVSVIVPNYNHADYLKERLDSVLNQSYQNFEVIILDDCSTDNSRNIIEQYRDHEKVAKIIYNEFNSGSTFKQWNKGIKLAQGELIWIAESDDSADLSLLQNLQQEFNSDTDLGIAYCQSNMINAKNEVTGSWLSWTDNLDSEFFKSRFKITGKDYINQFLVYKNTVPNASAVLFQKKYYQMTGGADTRILESGDWLTWIKILTVSNIVYIPQHFNNFRYHEKSVIAKAKKKSSERYIGRDEIVMRRYLQKYLKDSYAENKEFETIIYKNHHILVEQCAKESFYYFNRKNWLKGMNIIFKTSFSSIKNFLFLLDILLKKSFRKIKG